MTVSNFTILYVEDRDEDIFLLQHAFKKAGITNPVQVAKDGQQALDYLFGAGKFADRKQYPLPYLILLDLKLPHTRGLDVLQKIRQEPSLKWLIVIILSSSVHETDVSRAYSLGVNGFLVKPSSAHVLLNMCTALKSFWLDHNTPPLECREKLFP